MLEQSATLTSPTGTTFPVRERTSVVLSLGLGVDSTAILVRWLLEPASRDFDLADLVVVHAVVGDEYAATGELTRQHLLPLLRAHGVRLVQVARGGPSDRDGIVVLDDSRAPADIHLRGVWSLSDELRRTGTVPQVASGRRLCSVKFKGYVIDRWLAGELNGAPFRHVIGFAAEEVFRAERDSSYATAQRDSEYPLIEWGWDRQACLEYLHEVFGVQWERSCCTFCPFAGSKAGESDLRNRWSIDPAAGAHALLLEHVARALNPASLLFGSRAAADLAAGLPGVQAAYADLLAAQDWAVYRVRRIIHAAGGDPARKGMAWRSVQPLHTGTRIQAEQALATLAAVDGRDVVDGGDGIPRVWVRRRGQSYPTTEEMLVVAPATVAAKERAGFPAKWSALVDAPQLELFAG